MKDIVFLNEDCSIWKMKDENGVWHIYDTTGEIGDIVARRKEDDKDNGTR